MLINNILVYWFNTRGKGMKTFSKLQRNFNKNFQLFFKLYFTLVLFSYELKGYYISLSKYGVINITPLCTYSAVPARGLPSKGVRAMAVLPTLNNSLLIFMYFNIFYNFSFSAFFIA